MGSSLPRSIGRVGIISPSYELRRLLLDICHAGGWDAELWSAGHSAWVGHSVTHNDASSDLALQATSDRTFRSRSDRTTSDRTTAHSFLLWDFGELPRNRLDSIAARTCATHGIVALIDFPRAADFHAAWSAGLVVSAGIVVAKPFTAEELLAALEQAAASAGTH
jgi:hypothetical protein